MRAAALLGVLLVGCPSPADESDRFEPRGPCAPGEKVGGFTVAHEATYTAVLGSVATAALPTAALTEVGTYGDCVVWRGINPFCDPRCPNGELCAEGGVCTPAPENVDVGVVRVEGLLESVRMTPTDVGALYSAAGLPHPGYVPGAEIVLETGTGIRMVGEGPEFLEADVEWAIWQGQPLEVTWTPGTSAQARVVLSLNIDQHGSTPLTAVCEGADTGSITLPGDALSALLEGGVSGVPSAELIRRTVDSAESDTGCIEFVVASRLAAVVTTEGP